MGRLVGVAVRMMVTADAALVAVIVAFHLLFLGEIRDGEGLGRLGRVLQWRGDRGVSSGR